MSSQQIAIQHAIKRVAEPSYVPPVETPPTANPFRLGRLAAEHNLAPNRTWPARVVAGWEFEVSRKITPPAENCVVSATA
jgi:hypothetical protein